MDLIIYVAQIICSRGDLDRLCEIIIDTGLYDVLDVEDDTYTVFAPTDSAWKDFDFFISQNPFITEFTSDPDNTFNENNLINERVQGYAISQRGMVNYHTVFAALEIEDLSCGPNKFIRMIQGGATETLCTGRKKPKPSGQSGTCQDRLGQGSPKFEAEIEAKNGGVVHIINQVLLPSQQTTQEFLFGCEVWGTTLPLPIPGPGQPQVSLCK